MPGPLDGGPQGITTASNKSDCLLLPSLNEQVAIYSYELGQPSVPAYSKANPFPFMCSNLAFLRGFVCLIFLSFFFFFAVFYVEHTRNVKK